MKKLTVILSVLLILIMCLTLAACEEDENTGYTIGCAYDCCGSQLILKDVRAVNPEIYDLTFPDGKWVAVEFETKEDGVIGFDEFKEFLDKGGLKFDGKKAKDIYVREYTANLDLNSNSFSDSTLSGKVVVLFDVDKDLDVKTAELSGTRSVTPKVEQKGSPVLTIILIVVGAVVAIIVIAVIIDNSKKKKSAEAPEIRKEDDQNRTPGANEWKCPKCGKINQNYVGACGCGEPKAQPVVAGGAKKPTPRPVAPKPAADTYAMLSIYMDIDKLGGGAYGMSAGRAVARAVPASMMEGFAVSDGDSRATLFGSANEYVIGLRGKTAAIDAVEEKLRADTKLNELLSATGICRGNTNEPLVADGTVRGGAIIPPPGQSTSFCSAGFNNTWKQA